MYDVLVRDLDTPEWRTHLVTGSRYYATSIARRLHRALIIRVQKWDGTLVDFMAESA